EARISARHATRRLGCERTARTMSQDLPGQTEEIIGARRRHLLGLTVIWAVICALIRRGKGTDCTLVPGLTKLRFVTSQGARRQVTAGSRLAVRPAEAQD